MRHKVTHLRVIYEPEGLVIIPQSETPRGTAFMTGRIQVDLKGKAKEARKAAILQGVTAALEIV